MIFTVTPNTGIDHVLLLDRLRPGRRNQALRRVICMGGKGTDVSLILGQIGVATVATGFAAGENGARMTAMLEAAGVETAFLPVSGETRVNTVLYERETGTHTTVCAEGLTATPEDFAALAAWLDGRTGAGDIIVFAGSLPSGSPPDAYAPLIRAARERGAQTILDSSGPSLLEGLRASPWAVKPNREELESVAGPLDRGGQAGPAPLAAAVTTARSLLTMGVSRVVASLGADGLVAVEAESAWIAPSLAVDVCNPAGAGDAVVAAMALGAERGWAMEETLREAVALATAVVVTPGTAECDVRRLDELRARAVVSRWSDGGG
jgi:1-phosphofructokinase family hexose kinase